MEFIPVISSTGQAIKADYAINPTLLDSYLRFKRKDDDETFDSLMCKINGIKQELAPEVMEVIQKGIDFEDTINQALQGGEIEKTFITDKIVAKLTHCTGQQVYQEAFIHTPYGIIKLYGIIDYDFPEMIVDLKTVVHYSCGKYSDYSQHPMYSLIRELKGNPLKAFKYLITDFNRVYQETYIPSNHMYMVLMQNVYEFIAFINHFKPHITNTKIFGA